MPWALNNNNNNNNNMTDRLSLV